MAIIQAFEIAETLPAPPETVWETAADPALFPHWMSGLLSVAAPADGVFAAGAALPATVIGSRGTTRIDTELTLAVWDPPHGFALAVGDESAGTRYSYRFEPVRDGRATRATLTAEVAVSGAWRVFSFLLKRGMKRADGTQLKALKRLIDNA